MSLGGLQAKGLARGYAAGQTKIREQNADTSRGLFLRKLDVKRDQLPAFEAEFVLSFQQWSKGRDAGLDFQWFRECLASRC